VGSGAASWRGSLSFAPLEGSLSLPAFPRGPGMPEAHHQHAHSRRLGSGLGLGSLADPGCAVGGRAVAPKARLGCTPGGRLPLHLS